MTFALDQTVYNDLFTQLVDQGVSLGYLKGIVKTLDGESFLSQSFVRDEIKQYVSLKGRSSVQQLSGMQNVEHKIIYDAWSVLAPENDWTIVDDIVLARNYLQSLEEQVATFIRDNGIVSSVTCAQKFSLPFYYMQELLAKIVAQESFVTFPQLANTILTADYVEKTGTKIKNALKQAKEPLNVMLFQKSSFESAEELFNVLFYEAIQQSDLQGTVLKRGGKDIYVPNEYRDRQFELIRSLLNASGYIEYSTAEEHYAYLPPKELLRQIEPGIILLDTCAVTKEMLEKMVTDIRDDLESQGWSSVTQYVPFVFSNSDNASLQSIFISRLEEYGSPKPRKKNGASTDAPFILGSEHIATPKFLQTAMDALQPYIHQRARQELQQEKKMHSARGKKKLNSEISAKLSTKEVQNELIKCLHLDDDFASNVAEKIKAPLSIALTQAIRTVYALPLSNTVGNDAFLAKQLEEEEISIKDLSRKIFYTYKASEIFQDNDARRSIEKYILRQLGLDLVYHLVSKALLERKGGLDQEANQADDAKRKVLIEEYLKSSETSNLRDLYQSVTNDKRADKFIQNMQELVPDNWQDPDIQKETYEDIQATLRRQLENTAVGTETAPSILHLSSIVCFQSIYHLVLFVSGKYVPHIIKQISLQLEAETATMFNGCLETVMASRKQQADLDLDLISKVRQWALEQTTVK